MYAILAWDAPLVIRAYRQSLVACVFVASFPDSAEQGRLIGSERRACRSLGRAGGQCLPEDNVHPTPIEKGVITLLVCRLAAVLAPLQCR